MGDSERIESLSPNQQIILEGVLAREEARHHREDSSAARERSRQLRASSVKVKEAAEAGNVDALVHEIEGLHDALATRMVISNAVGLLMAWGRVDRDEAFSQLRRASQRSNRKLREVAAELVERHERNVREGARQGAILPSGPARTGFPQD